MITHQRIQLLLAKSALSCWMYPTAQIALSPTPSHPWVPPEWPYCQQAQFGRWFTVKHSKAGLQIQVLILALITWPATDPNFLWCQPNKLNLKKGTFSAAKKKVCECKSPMSPIVPPGLPKRLNAEDRLRLKPSYRAWKKSPRVSDWIDFQSCNLLGVWSLASISANRDSNEMDRCYKQLLAYVQHTG